ncbi:beta-selinene synthase-like isoform X2 [Triticum urartu]|uniref:beta-selinene synthase-like isoform X2 n=1 Tax=Triticum urartu TaxID=4572 RepID=UPI002043BB5B|nr:beta-selinene synthase-like isoform X2 [Triticum urartu]
MAASKPAATADPGKQEMGAFEPCVWGDFFVTYNPPLSQSLERSMRERAEQLKDQVRGLFEDGEDRSVADVVTLVETLERLGIDYHFRGEIGTALRRILNEEPEHGTTSPHDLHVAALRFRLLRQHGFWVSADIFDKFKDETGNFSPSLRNDPVSLLSLYNAAHMATPSEDTLNDVIVFSRYHLEVLRNKLRPPMAEQVSRALDIPLPRTVGRLETMNYIREYEQVELNSGPLLELSKLDFELVRSLHLKELKALSLWDRSAASILPEYLHTFYIKLLDNIKEFEDTLGPHEKYRLSYAEEAIKSLSEYYLHEAKWSNEKYAPSSKEHLEVSHMSLGFPTLAIVMLMGVDNTATKKAFDWAVNVPNIVRASGQITRFLNDIASYKMGKTNNKDVANSVECYMKEHLVAGEEVVAVISALAEDTWRMMNQACMEIEPALLPAAQLVVNLTKMLEVIYLGGRDGYTFGGDLKSLITGLFLKPIVVG